LRKRPVGDVVGSEFVKPIREKGYLRVPPAICFDVDTLQAAERAGARFIRVVDRDNGTEYLTTFVKIWRDSFTLDRGFGVQRGLLLSEWDVIEPKPAPVQLSF